MKKQMKRLILTALLAGVSVGVPARTPGLPAADTVSGAMPAAPVSAPVAAASDTSGGERSEWLAVVSRPSRSPAPVDIRFVQVPDTEAPRDHLRYEGLLYDPVPRRGTRPRVADHRAARRPPAQAHDRHGVLPIRWSGFRFRMPQRRSKAAFRPRRSILRWAVRRS